MTKKRPEGRVEAAVYKSRAEVQIARLFEREGIAFRYEHPLAVVDRGRLRVWYPDFTLPEYGMIVEYFGMSGDPGYRDRMEHKMRVYRQSGIEGVFLTEESLTGPWAERILGKIEGVLHRRLDQFYGSGRRVGAVQRRRPPQARPWHGSA